MNLGRRASHSIRGVPCNLPIGLFNNLLVRTTFPSQWGASTHVIPQRDEDPRARHRPFDRLANSLPF